MRSFRYWLAAEIRWAKKRDRRSGLLSGWGSRQDQLSPHYCMWSEKISGIRQGDILLPAFRQYNSTQSSHP
jgi:hypothetical protein